MWSLETFDTEQGNIKTYLDRFDSFCMANDIQNEKKACTLIAVMGSKAYEKIYQEGAHSSVSDILYPNLNSLLLKAFEKQVNEIVARYMPKTFPNCKWLCERVKITSSYL